MMWSSAYCFEVSPTNINRVMEQRMFVRGKSQPNINRVMLLWIFLYFFRFRLTSPTVYIRSSWNLIYSKTMMWNSIFYFAVTFHYILAELCSFENSVNFRFRLTSPIVYIRSNWNFVKTYTMIWSSAYYFEVTVHQIIPELCLIKIFHELFISGKLLLQFTSRQAKNWFIVRPWCGAARIILRLQYTKY